MCASHCTYWSGVRAGITADRPSAEPAGRIRAGSGGSPMQDRNAFSSASTRSKLPTLPVTNPTEYPPPGQNPFPHPPGKMSPDW